MIFLVNAQGTLSQRNINVGQRLELACPGSSNSAFRWISTKNLVNTTLATKDNLVVTNFPSTRYSLTSAFSLVITNIEISDEAMFWCAPQGSSNSPLASIYKVTVTGDYLSCNNHNYDNM